jgi:hypothetical protein
MLYALCLTPYALCLMPNWLTDFYNNKLQTTNHKPNNKQQQQSPTVQVCDATGAS